MFYRNYPGLKRAYQQLDQGPLLHPTGPLNLMNILLRPHSLHWRAHHTAYNELNSAKCRLQSSQCTAKCKVSLAECIGLIRELKQDIISLFITSPSLLLSVCFVTSVACVNFWSCGKISALNIHCIVKSALYVTIFLQFLVKLCR